MDTIRTPSMPPIRSRQQGIRFAPATEWVETIVRYHTELGMDSFIYWPVAGDEREQARLFVEEVVPAVRELIEGH